MRVNCDGHTSIEGLTLTIDRSCRNCRLGVFLSLGICVECASFFFRKQLHNILKIGNVVVPLPAMAPLISQFAQPNPQGYAWRGLVK